MIICKRCNKEKEHHAFGLCGKCYIWLRYNKPETLKQYKESSCKRQGCTNPVVSNRLCYLHLLDTNNKDRRKTIVITHGVPCIFDPQNPMADNRGYVRQDRLVMSQIIGRILEKQEITHHIDENPHNNERSNLMLFPNMDEHTRHHRGLI